MASGGSTIKAECSKDGVKVVQKLLTVYSGWRCSPFLNCTTVTCMNAGVYSQKPFISMTWLNHILTDAFQRVLRDDPLIPSNEFIVAISLIARSFCQKQVLRLQGKLCGKLCW